METRNHLKNGVKPKNHMSRIFLISVMKKIILVAIIIMSSCFMFNIRAQTPSDSTKTSKFVYCELIGTPNLLSQKITIYVDYGKETELFQDTRMKDEQTGKVKSFNSMVDALNYMENNGWEFVQAYIETIGQQNVYHWLLKNKK